MFRRNLKEGLNLKTNGREDTQTALNEDISLEENCILAVNKRVMSNCVQHVSEIQFARHRIAVINDNFQEVTRTAFLTIPTIHYKFLRSITIK